MNHNRFFLFLMASLTFASSMKAHAEWPIAFLDAEIKSAIGFERLYEGISTSKSLLNDQIVAAKQENSNRPVFAKDLLGGYRGRNIKVAKDQVAELDYVLRARKRFDDHLIKLADRKDGEKTVQKYLKKLNQRLEQVAKQNSRINTKNKDRASSKRLAAEEKYLRAAIDYTSQFRLARINSSELQVDPAQSENTYSANPADGAIPIKPVPKSAPLYKSYGMSGR